MKTTKMKKGALLIIIVSIISLVGVILYQFNSLKLDDKTVETVKTAKLTMPLFEFTTLNGTKFSKYDLDKNKAAIIIYFDPECELCERPAKILYKFQKIYKASQVLFVSSSTAEKTRDYIKKFKLNRVSNIKFYLTDFDMFYKLFNETKTPTYFIYNNKGKHIKTINDKIPVKTLFRYIEAAQQNE